MKVSGDSQAMQQTLTDSMPFLLNDLQPEARQQLGYQMQELINFCEFNEKKCDLRYVINERIIYQVPRQKAIFLVSR